MGQPQHEVLSALLPPEAIRLRVQAMDWRCAVVAVGELLVASGATTPVYTDEMIATVEKMGPYIVLAPGIALPHARPSPAVLRTGLSLVTLAEPVPFGHPQNDPVSLLIAFAAADNKAHVRALSTLAGLLLEEQFRAALLQARDPQGIRGVIESYETGQATSPKAGDPRTEEP